MFYCLHNSKQGTVSGNPWTLCIFYSKSSDAKNEKCIRLKRMLPCLHFYYGRDLQVLLWIRNRIQFGRLNTEVTLEQQRICSYVVKTNCCPINLYVFYWDCEAVLIISSFSQPHSFWHKLQLAFLRVADSLPRSWQRDSCMEKHLYVFHDIQRNFKGGLA